MSNKTNSETVQWLSGIQSSSQEDIFNLAKQFFINIKSSRKEMSTLEMFALVMQRFPVVLDSWIVTTLGEILRLHGILYRKLGNKLIQIWRLYLGQGQPRLQIHVIKNLEIALLKPGTVQIFIPYNGSSMAIEMVQYLFLNSRVQPQKWPSV